MRIRTAVLVIGLIFALNGISVSGQVIVLTEDFDSVTAPDLPNGWQIQGDGWISSTSSSSSGSGANNLAHIGGSAGSVISPAIDLSGFVSPELSFLARRTSSYPQDSLAIHASIDGGISYPVLIAAQGVALPVATSSYESIVISLPAVLSNQPSVRLRFEALGGTTGGSNIRFDDLVLTAAVDNGGTVPPDSASTIGFSFPSSTAFERSTVIAIPIELVAIDSLHSLQFTVSWSSAIISLVDVQGGSSIADSLNWKLDWATAGDSVQILLVANDVFGLSPGTYTDFLSLHFGIQSLDSSVSEFVQLLISRPIAARSTPSGDDAELGLGQFQHELEIEAPKAFFVPAEIELDFGFVVADSVSTLDLSISNPLGTKDLVVSSVASSSVVFTPLDTSLTVPPNQTAVLRVAFEPTVLAFGYLSAALTIEHNGTQGPTDIIPMSGVGTGGRGDADHDGVVDIGDVIVGIDVILGRLASSQVQIAPIDLHPFPSGNSEMDVRDLTVLMHAVVRGYWPDSINIPSVSPNQQTVITTTFAHSDGGFTAPVSFLFRMASDESIEVYLSNVVPMRGFELRLEDLDWVNFDPAFSISSNSSAFVFTHFDERNRSAHILFASSSETSIEPGLWHMGKIRLNKQNGLPEVAYATAIGDDRRRLNVAARIVAVTTELSDQNLDSTPTLGMPFPNPYSLGTGRLITIPIIGGQLVENLRLEVYDILGRRLLQKPITPNSLTVKLDPRNEDLNLSPGVYFVRMVYGSFSTTRSITITHGAL